MIEVRRGMGCNFHITSFNLITPLTCSAELIRKAGWHFSSVLSDQELLRKMRSIAESFGTDRVVTNFTEFRLSKPEKNAYLKDFII